MNGQPTYSDADEAGAQDNLLSLNPNDPQWKDDIGDWEDDKVYPIPTGTMRQISPGEFAIVKAKFSASGGESETPAEDAGESDEGAADETPPEPPMSKNPAMDNYLKRKYKSV